MIRALLALRPYRADLPLLSRLGIWWECSPIRHRLSGPVFSKRWDHRLFNWLDEKRYRGVRWLQGARAIDTVGGIDELHLTGGSIDDDGISISWGGACPVQGDGEINGRSCYYRSRGEGWQFHVAAPRADDPLADEAWSYEERKHQKAQIQKLETEMRRLSSEVREKVTYRDVDCERRFIYADKLVRDVRSDTGETLHERPMSEQESQRQFDFDKKSGDVDDEFDTSDGGEAAE